MKPAWTCKKCKEEIEDGFDACWKCGALRDGSVPSAPMEEIGDQGFVEQRSSKSPKGSISSRYKDAYHTANAITSVGATIKFLALVIGGLIALISLGIVTQNSSGWIGLIVAVVVAVPIYILGILVAAQGQILKATLDTAVNSSKFLAEKEMKEIMFWE